MSSTISLPIPSAANYDPLSVAPLNLGRNCLSLIEREAAHARAGRPSLHCRQSEFPAR